MLFLIPLQYSCHGIFSTFLWKSEVQSIIKGSSKPSVITYDKALIHV